MTFGEQLDSSIDALLLSEMKAHLDFAQSILITNILFGL